MPSNFKGSGLTLARNEWKDIIKGIRSLENRKILLEITTRKNSTQKEYFSIF